MKFIPTAPASSQTLLAIYLNDHLAGATAGVELARRCRQSNTEPPLSDDLDWLVEQLLEDRRSLQRAMSLLDVSRSPWKPPLAFLAEKAGRAKLNGQLTGYSPLSRVLELEGLLAGITAKLSLWRALGQVAEQDARLRGFGLDEMVKRAEEQREVVERHRRDAVAQALT